ncbi:MAG: isoleucyl-tRNA synthetase, partial [Actinomycetota bacterium]|nr:isoleucyl-tRNA synthetase [Actinomycetota bacterium]
HDTCIGSVAELAELSGRDLSELDLHRPYVDEVTFPCPVDDCGAVATRLEPVLDAWFDSGSMPAAQFHHPFASDGVFEARFPADFICEAIDQTRGWFYSLLAVNTLVFGQAPYRNVVCLAHVVDQDGAKMSKSKGNVIDPWEIFRTKGADPLRWYFFSAGSPWTNRRVYGEGIDESIRKFLLTLWNTLSFFVTYANLEGFDPAPNREKAGAPPVEHVLDRWLASRREATVKAVTDALEAYDTLTAAQTLEAFVDDLSNWYVRRSRPRFWKASDPGAFAALHRSLSTVALLLAPFTPFVADEIYRVLSAGAGEVSVHLEDWPVADESVIDADLEAEMALARRLVALGRAARGEARMKVRQPLRRALLLVPGLADSGSGRLSSEVAAQVSEELNVKALEVVESLAGLIRYSVVPNFRVLGPRLGPKLPAVKAALASADGAEVSRSLEETGSYTVTIDGPGEGGVPETTAVVLGAGDLEVRAEEHEEFALAQDGPYAVALDLHVDEDLRLEGLARELARAVNDHRKARGLAIADRIKVRLWAEGPVAEAAARHGAWIAGEVLAVDWQVNPAESPSGEVLDVEGSPVTLAIEVASSGP